MKILSLRGGGIRGLATAAFWRAYEQDTGVKTSDTFDLFAGTSTGGILAISFGLGITAASLVQFYLEKGPQIFSRQWRHYFGLTAARYSSQGLNSAIFSVFGAKSFAQCAKPTIVPATNLATLSARFFKSWRSDAKNLCAHQVATATSSAPTYFDPFVIDGIPYADGGLYANNPGLYALSEAMYELHEPVRSVRMIDMACPSPNARPVTRGGGLLGFAPRMADVFMDAGMDAGEEVCHRILNGKFMAVHPSLAMASPAMDCTSEKNMQALIGAGELAYDISGDGLKNLLRNKK